MKGGGGQLSVLEKGCKTARSYCNCSYIDPLLALVITKSGKE